jgi:hypothetical protein
VSRGRGGLRLMVDAPPLNSGLRPLGDASLRAIDPHLSLCTEASDTFDFLQDTMNISFA